MTLLIAVHVTAVHAQTHDSKGGINRLQAVVGLYAFNPDADAALLLAHARWQAAAAAGVKSVKSQDILAAN